MEKDEIRNRRIGLFTSATVHGILLLLFLFSMAWRAPDPPLPEFGIELNFGVEPEGSGDIQPETPPASEPQPEEGVAESVETDQVEPETKEEVVVSKVESVVPLKEENKKAAEPEKPKEEEKLKTVYKPEEKQPESKVTPQPQGHGDDKDKAGDKGNPEGKLDSRALYGKQGGGAGGDGMVLSMSGWAWADHPDVPEIPDNEDGRIVFEIECDAEGEIIRITTLERGLSPAAEKLLKDEISRNSLVRTTAGQTPEKSKGQVVFLLKTR